MLGNALNFNVGEGVKFALPNVFWTRLSGKYGTVSSSEWKKHYFFVGCCTNAHFLYLSPSPNHVFIIIHLGILCEGKRN